MSGDRPFLGIVLMIGFCLLAPISDVLAKILGDHMSLVQLVTVRFALMGILLVPMVAVTTGLKAMRFSRRIFWLTVLRTILHLAGTAAFFGALRYLPIADALAIAFILPFLMLLTGKFFLNEVVGKRRLWACFFGFIGTLLVIQPSFAEVGLPALLPLIVAVVFTFFMLITRVIAKDVDPVALQATSGLIATTMMVPFFVVGISAEWVGFEYTEPSVSEIWMLLALGALATTAHVMMTWSLRFAPSATVAPIQYLEIPFATLAGWVVFSDLPNGLAAVGIMITIGAGLYILIRERAVSKMDPDTAPA